MFDEAAYYGLIRARIRRLIEEQNTSISAVSLKAELERSTLRKFLNGNIDKMADWRLRRVASALGVSFEYLCGKEDLVLPPSSGGAQRVRLENLKITPGPWTYTDIPPYREEDGENGLFVHLADRTLIAVCDGSRKLPDEEIRANTVAISAVPEMIVCLLIEDTINTLGFTKEALKQLAEQGIEAPPEAYWSVPAMQRWRKEKRRAALKKAGVEL